MAKKIVKETWRSDDGSEYETEIEALRADVKYWKSEYDRVVNCLPQKRKQSSYGSSGGGGHD